MTEAKRGGSRRSLLKTGSAAPLAASGLAAAAQADKPRQSLEQAALTCGRLVVSVSAQGHLRLSLPVSSKPRK